MRLITGHLRKTQQAALLDFITSLTLQHSIPIKQSGSTSVHL